MAINALLGCGEFQNRIDVQFLFFLDGPIDGDIPRARLEIFRQVGGTFFVGREFVIVVVMGHVRHRSDFLCRRKRTLLQATDLVVGRYIFSAE